MPNLIDRLVSRFPQHETLLRKMKDVDKTFGNIFQEFEQVEHRLSKFDEPPRGEGEVEHDRLRHRRALLEEELLMIMQQQGRI